MKLNEKNYIKIYKTFQKKVDDKFKVAIKDLIKIAEALEDESHTIGDDVMHSKINTWENFRKLVRETNFSKTSAEGYDVVEGHLKTSFFEGVEEINFEAPALTKDQSEFRFYYDLVVAAIKCGRLEHEIKGLREVASVNHTQRAEAR